MICMFVRRTFCSAEHRKNLKIIILTVVHNLRNGSADEALYVGELCNKLGLIHKTLFWAHEDIKGNLSASAREARYRLMQNSIPSGAILITGHTGFKGVWLTEWLLSLGADIMGISKGKK